MRERVSVALDRRTLTYLNINAVCGSTWRALHIYFKVISNLNVKIFLNVPPTRVGIFIAYGANRISLINTRGATL